MNDNSGNPMLDGNGNPMLIRNDIDNDIVITITIQEVQASYGQVKLTKKVIDMDKKEFYSDDAFVFTMTGNEFETSFMLTSQKDKNSITVSLPVGTYDIKELQVMGYEVVQSMVKYEGKEEEDLLDGTIIVEKDKLSEVTFLNSILKKTNSKGNATNILHTSSTRVERK